MAISRIKTWLAGEILTAVDLNNEFNNIINGDQAIGTPRSTLFDMDGQELVLDANADTSIRANTDDQIDIKIAGADDFRFNANVFNVLAGSNIVVHPAASGATADTDADELVLENNLDGGMSILVPANRKGRISFGDPAAVRNATVVWDPTAGTMSVGTVTTATGVLDLQSGNANTRIRLGQNNTVGIRVTLNTIIGTDALTVTPEATLHVHTATAGAFTPNVNSDDLVVENSGNCGITIVSPDANEQRLTFANISTVRAAEIGWDHTTNLFRIGTRKAAGVTQIDSANAVNAIYIDSSQNIHLNGTLPLAPLHQTKNSRDAMILEDLGSGSATGPTLYLWRNSSAPLANDGTGRIVWQGQNAAAARTSLALIRTDLLVTTAGAEHAELVFQAVEAGTMLSYMKIDNGVFGQGVTGAGQGQGTSNWTGVFQQGKKLGWEIIESGTVSNAAELALINLSADYRAYMLVFDNLLPVTDDVGLYIQTSVNNGSTYTTGATAYRSARDGFGVGAARQNSLESSQIELSPTGSTFGHGNVTGGAGEEGSGNIICYNPMFATAKTEFTWHLAYNAAAGGTNSFTISDGSGVRTNQQANNAFKVFFSTGNISTMNYTFYGMRAS